MYICAFLSLANTSQNDGKNSISVSGLHSCRQACCHCCFMLSDTHSFIQASVKVNQPMWQNDTSKEAVKLTVILSGSSCMPSCLAALGCWIWKEQNFSKLCMYAPGQIDGLCIDYLSLLRPCKYAPGPRRWYGRATPADPPHLSITLYSTHEHFSTAWVLLY